MNSKDIRQFLTDNGLSLNKVGKSTSIAPSNISRMLRVDKEVTATMVVRMAHVYPQLLDYITDPVERRSIESASLPKKYQDMGPQPIEGLYLKILIPEARMRYTAQAPKGRVVLNQYNVCMDIMDSDHESSMMVIQLIESDLGPRLLPGDLVRAVEVKEKDWPYTHGLVFIVYSTYSIVKVIHQNRLSFTENSIVLRGTSGGDIEVPGDQIRQIMKVDKLLRGELSF